MLISSFRKTWLITKKILDINKKNVFVNVQKICLLPIPKKFVNKQKYLVYFLECWINALLPLFIYRFLLPSDHRLSSWSGFENCGNILDKQIV